MRMDVGGRRAAGYDQDWHYATLSAAMKIELDGKSPIAKGNVMKSGYGINETVTADVQIDRFSAVTEAQSYAVPYLQGEGQL